MDSIIIDRIISWIDGGKKDDELSINNGREYTIDNLQAYCENKLREGFRIFLRGGYDIGSTIVPRGDTSFKKAEAIMSIIYLFEDCYKGVNKKEVTNKVIKWLEGSKPDDRIEFKYGDRTYSILQDEPYSNNVPHPNVYEVYFDSRYLLLIVPWPEGQDSRKTAETMLDAVWEFEDRIRGRVIPQDV